MYSALYKIFKGSAQGKLRGSYLKALGKRGRSIRKTSGLAQIAIERQAGSRIRIHVKIVNLDKVVRQNVGRSDICSHSVAIVRLVNVNRAAVLARNTSKLLPRIGHTIIQNATRVRSHDLNIKIAGSAGFQAGDLNKRVFFDLSAGEQIVLIARRLFSGDLVRILAGSLRNRLVLFQRQRAALIKQLADRERVHNRAALRRQIEKHPIWQYPPEERLQHNREWQSLYLLVFEFKEFLQKLENRLNNAEYDTGLLKQDEDAMLDARYTRRSKLRNKLDTLTFTEAMRKAVARYDASSGKEFMAYFDTIYANAMHEAMNRQSMREQGDIRLNRGEARLWKRLCELCDKQGIDPSELSDAFYDRAADILDVDADALKSIGRNATAARRTVSLNDPGNDRDDGSGFDMADPNQENMQEHLERTTEALRAIAMFASKDVKEYPRLFFTTDVLGPLCTDKPELPPERYCALLEKQEALLWEQILVKGYIHYLFEPNKPERLRAMLDIAPTHPLQDSSVAAYQHVTAAAVSYQRRRYAKILQEISKQLQK